MSAAFRMSPVRNGSESGCGEGGADRLVVCDEQDVWSSDRYTDLGLSMLILWSPTSVVVVVGVWLLGDLEPFLCFLYFT